MAFDVNKWMREWRKKHRPEVNKRMTAWRNTAKGALSKKRHKAAKRNKVRQLVYEARNKPCVDCGLHLPPELMELDHRDGRDFKGGWSRFTVTTVQVEILKCDVRCPICHKIRHFIEDGGVYGMSHEHKARIAKIDGRRPVKGEVA